MDHEIIVQKGEKAANRLSVIFTIFAVLSLFISFFINITVPETFRVDEGVRIFIALVSSVFSAVCWVIIKDIFCNILKLLASIVYTNAEILKKEENIEKELTGKLNDALSALAVIKFNTDKIVESKNI